MTTPLLPAIYDFLALENPSRDDVRNIIAKVALWVGGGFHPDTPAEDYVNLKSGGPTFTAQDAVVFERVREAMFKFDDLDPSAVAFSSLYPAFPSKQAEF